MLKRKPYIAALILVIAIAGAVWAVWIVARYMFYNPIERISFADLPREATQEAHYNFISPGPPSGKFELPFVSSPVPSGMPWPPPRDAVFSFLNGHEGDYLAKAQTMSAFDPITDEYLQNSLRELMKIRDDDEAERLALFLTLYNALVEKVKDSTFKQALYGYLAQETLRSSMDNPNVYPLRLAEVKSGFYDSKMKDASDALDNAILDFDSGIKEQIGALRENQDSETMRKILEIRDYLLEKTSAIKQDSHNGNGGEN